MRGEGEEDRGDKQGNEMDGLKERMRNGELRNETAGEMGGGMDVISSVKLLLC